MQTVAIVIPTLNEEDGIVRVIDAIPQQRLQDDGYVVETVIVDGNSQDRTVERAKAAGARVILEEKKGKGKAIETAFKKIAADYLIMIDGDNTYPADRIPAMLEALKEYDVVIGSRLTGHIEKGAITRLNLAGNHMLTGLANTLYRTNITDLCSGLWGFRGNVTREINIAAPGFDLEANIFSECVKHGFTVGEVPVDYRVRIATSKLSPLDGLIIAESLVVNVKDSVRLARLLWMKKLYGSRLIGGRSLRRRNIAMPRALFIKMNSVSRKRK